MFKAYADANDDDRQLQKLASLVGKLLMIVSLSRQTREYKPIIFVAIIITKERPLDWPVEENAITKKENHLVAKA